MVIKRCPVGRFVFLYQDFLDFEWSAVPMFKDLSWGGGNLEGISVYGIGDQVEMAATILLEGCDDDRKFIRNDLTKTIYKYTVLYWVADVFDIGFWWDFEYTDFHGFQLEVWE